jgi:ligand-binding SRPBCC domain-containing protein
MHILITTSVNQPVQKVFAGFTRSLFLKLNPPGLSATLLRFDGTHQGGITHLQLNFGLFKQDWISINTHFEESPQEISFIDEGQKLPFFLKTWHHHHRVMQNGTGAKIVDDIHFQSYSNWLTLLLYPLLYFTFYYRKHVYLREFK